MKPLRPFASVDGDAQSVARARRLGITAIASDDDAFGRCAGISLFKPRRVGHLARPAAGDVRHVSCTLCTICVEGWSNREASRENRPLEPGARVQGHEEGSNMRGDRMTRRRMAALSAGGAGLVGGVPLMLAACGAGGGAEQAAPQDTGGPPVEIRWTDSAGPEEVAFGEEFARRFTAKHPRITPVLEPFVAGGWKERAEKYTTMAVSGTMPELVWFSEKYLRVFLIRGFARELDPFIKRDLKPADVDDFYKGPWEGMKVDGKQLAIPATINNNLMYVNTNHLREAALAYPGDGWTRQQFLDYVLTLHKRGQGRWGFDMDFANLDRNVSWILMAGGEPHDPKDGPVVTRLTYDDPKTIEGLQFLHDFRWKHRTSPLTNADRGDLSVENAFLNGKTSIYMVASNNSKNILRQGAELGLAWDFLTLPKGPGGQGARVSMDGYVLDKQSKVGEQAWTVLRELSSAETAPMLTQVRRLTSPRKSGAAPWEKGFEGKNAKIARPLAEAARADPRAFWKDADMVGPIVSKYVNASLNANEIAVAEAMRRAMAEVRDYYAANK
jgi:ABC-type glycerol-3-phosphate transport system substrate-binding protein